MELWDSIVQSPRMAGGAPPTYLRGPFDPWLRAPAAGLAAAALGEELRFRSSLPDVLRELAILTVGARWRADYEFWAHARIGQAAGLGDAVIDALRLGMPVPYEDDDQRLVHASVLSLLATTRIPDDLYGRAIERFGEQGVVELVMLVGLYVMVSMTLNTFEVELPPGERVDWDEV